VTLELLIIINNLFNKNWKVLNLISYFYKFDNSNLPPPCYKKRNKEKLRLGRNVNI